MQKRWVIFMIAIIVIILFLWVLEIPRYTVMNSQELPKLIYNNKRKDKTQRRSIITLTTIPSRLEYLKPTIASLLDQTIRVDEISINIPIKTSKGEFYIIPTWLKNLSKGNTNIKIHTVPKDLGPGTKILPTLKRELKFGHNETMIIAVDDDNIYGSSMIQNLISEFEKHDRKAAITNYGIKMLKKAETAEFPYEFPFKYDRLAKTFSKRRQVDFLQGCSGFLVTPEMFPKQVFEIEKGPREAFYVDDMWLSGWLKFNQIEIWQPSYNIKFFPIPYIQSWLNTPSLISAENHTNQHNNKSVIMWFRNNKGVKLLCELK